MSERPLIDNSPTDKKAATIRIVDEIKATGTSKELGDILAKREGLLHHSFSLSRAQRLELRDIQRQLLRQLGIVGFTRVTMAYFNTADLRENPKK